MKIGNQPLKAWVDENWPKTERETSGLTTQQNVAVEFLEGCAKYLGCHEGEDITPVLSLLPFGLQACSEWLHMKSKRAGAHRTMRRTWQREFAAAGAWKAKEVSGAALVAFVVEKMKARQQAQAGGVLHG